MTVDEYSEKYKRRTSQMYHNSIHNTIPPLPTWSTTDMNDLIMFAEAHLALIQGNRDMDKHKKDALYQ